MDCRKIPTIWKLWIVLNCGKIPTIWKEWKFVCGLNQIVGKFLQFERCVLNWIIGKYLQFERCVEDNCYDWTKFMKIIRFEKVFFFFFFFFLMWMGPNCRKIPTIWNMSIRLNCRKMPAIWKICAGKLLWLNQIVGRLYYLKRVKFLCGLDQIVGKFLQFQKYGLNKIVRKYLQFERRMQEN